MKKFVSSLVGLAMFGGMISLTSFRADGSVKTQTVTVIQKYDRTGRLTDDDCNVLLDYLESAINYGRRLLRESGNRKDKDHLNYMIKRHYPEWDDVLEILSENMPDMSSAVQTRFRTLEQKYKHL